MQILQVIQHHIHAPHRTIMRQVGERGGGGGGGVGPYTHNPKSLPHTQTDYQLEIPQSDTADIHVCLDISPVFKITAWVLRKHHLIVLVQRPDSGWLKSCCLLLVKPGFKRYTFGKSCSYLVLKDTPLENLPPTGFQNIHLWKILFIPGFKRYTFRNLVSKDTPLENLAKIWFHKIHLWKILFIPSFKRYTFEKSSSNMASKDTPLENLPQTWFQ